MTRFYTGRGDEGWTDLLGARVPKYDPRTELIGALDESTSQIGLARSAATSARTAGILIEVQRDLYQLMAETAFVSEELAAKYQLGAGAVLRIGRQADDLAADVPLANEFILPGDSFAGATLDVARVVVRRAERVASRLAHEDQLRSPSALAYLNRLSSLLFVLGRFEDQEAGVTPSTAKDSD